MWPKLSSETFETSLCNSYTDVEGLNISSLKALLNDMLLPRHHRIPMIEVSMQWHLDSLYTTLVYVVFIMLFANRFKGGYDKYIVICL